MALSEAVIEIVAEMEKSASDSADKTPLTWPLVRSWTMALKAAVKASQTPAPLKPIYTDHRAMIDAEREKVRNKKMEAEDRGPKMVICLGGKADGDHFVIDSSMPVGAYTKVAGETYQLEKDGYLHAAVNGDN